MFDRQGRKPKRASQGVCGCDQRVSSVLDLYVVVLAAAGICYGLKDGCCCISVVAAGSLFHSNRGEYLEKEDPKGVLDIFN